MSRKPLKKSDLNKGWMRKRQDRAMRIRPEYHLIVTEGTRTEPQYFDTIRGIINARYRERIQLDICAEGDNTLHLLMSARKRVQNNPNGYRHVWIVYDTDDFPAHSINQTASLCDQYSNEETRYHAIWSNQCIELWFLLHFQYMQSDIHRSEYISKLNECLGGIQAGEYTKGRSDMYQVLRPYMETAITNAHKLDCANKDKAPADAAPGTKVFELIEALVPYLDDRSS